MCEFASVVMAHNPAIESMPKLQLRWEQGLWLGKRVASDEHLVALPEGVKSVRTIRHVSLKEQNPAHYYSLCWTPWGRVTAQPTSTTAQPASTTAQPASTAAQPTGIVQPTGTQSASTTAQPSTLVSRPSKFSGSGVRGPPSARLLQ